MITAYFDESGHDDRLLVVGGLVSTPEHWAFELIEGAGKEK